MQTLGSEHERTLLYSDFRRALTREILLTERLRVKAQIMTVSVLVACLLTAFVIVPDTIERIWHGGFALRPVLAALKIEEQEEFLDEYGRLLGEAYPSTPFGTVYPFRRIFAVACKQ